MKFEQKIKKVTKSNNHIIYVSTIEEEILENILIKINNKIFHNQIVIWDFIEGYQNQPTGFSSCKQNPLEALNMIQKYNTINENIFFLKDFNFFLNDLTINRKIKNLYKWLKQNNNYLFMSGIEMKIPTNLNNYIKCIKLPLPDEEEIKSEIQNFFNKTSINIEKHNNIICKTYKGFSRRQIRKSLFELLEKDLTISEIIQNIFKDKSENFSSVNGLKLCTQNTKIVKLAGFNNLKRWLKLRNIMFSKKAEAYGVRSPKGILLVGIQGTGKSLSAKSISQEWNLPLLKLDVGKIFASTLGESENRIDKVIEISQAMSPCVLWIDEIEKIFTKNSNNNDSGTTQRVTSIILNWLSDKTDETFILATANQINNLPIEMLRKGRFDEIFFVDLPNFKDRMNIFRAHLSVIRPITWNQYNIYYFCKISNGFSGAEIEQAIVNAMYLGFSQERELTSSDIVNAIDSIIPTARTHNNEIKKMRQWGYSGKTQIV
uniref:Uncharacterized AAA domain-containing protein ycf46 n=1 Tax=Leptosiphonia brodiei TaxID=2608611 RepID=A0A1Z1MAE9_9FLOR|nr:hypothetical protein [Leptosiphonia brodiei]ARW62801.1 hypothetical protein [Leptosiphonia brodiei]